jgi:hypothetical protein
MRLKNISSYQEIRAYIANKLALPLVVLESLEKGREVNNCTIAAAKNELKNIVVYLDKQWITKKRSKK